MENNRETETKPVLTQFDAWAYLYRDKSLKGAAKRALAFELIGFWGMGKERRCFPSQTTLMQKLGIKSKDTLRSLLDQLILSGYFAELRKPGCKTEFFPMFVHNARIDLLEASQQEVRDRQAGRKSKSKMTDAKKPAVEQTPTAQDVASDVAPTPEADPENESSHGFGSWVKTDADLVFANNYALEMKALAEYPEAGPPAGWTKLYVVSSVAETGLDDMWSKPRCYINGGWGCFVDSLPGHWVKQWGGNYGSQFSLSQIASVYAELLTTSNGERPMPRMVDEIDVAMHVLGKDGFVPSKAVVDALRYAPYLDDHMSELRVAYQETLRARELCREHIQRGNYKTTSYSN